MYILNKQNNQMEPLEQVTFKSLGIKERRDLQEWIARKPDVFGEELLIIQKEFDGFDGTSERLDLLALDKQGNLVIVENKLDSSGKDVVWQALKYASYCSSLTVQNIKDIYRDYLIKFDKKEKCEDLLIEFFGNEDYEKTLNNGSKQRIIMVAGEFRKEVTSTVVWLFNYGLRLQCFRASAYRNFEQMFINFEQVLPVKEVEDYTIKMADKQRENLNNQEEMSARHYSRKRFWSQFLKLINEQTSLCGNVNPGIEQWIPVSLGISGIAINLVISQKYVRTELYINRGTAEENKKIFDFFFSMKEKIETDFGEPLTWERMDDRVTSRIKIQVDGINAYDSEYWSKINPFLINSTLKMEKSFKEPIEKLRRVL